MASLSQVTKTARHFLVIATLCVISIFVIMFAVHIAQGIQQSLHPTPPQPPNTAFGKLPPISFPSNANIEHFTFSLDTLSGNLPNLGDQATIYKMQPVLPNLLALDSAKEMVAKVGFAHDPTRISDTQYQWINDDSLPKTLVMNIFNNNFIIDSDFLNNQDVLQANNLPDEDGAIASVTTFLQNFGLYPSDIDTGKTKATLFSITNGQLTSASSLSVTQIIRIDFFQTDVHSLHVFYPQATYSTMSMLVGGGDTNAQIVEARFSHQSIGKDNATYPIISSQQAFDLLKKNEGYIASYDNTGTQITIHNIVLGYYIGDDVQQYLEPIIVFEGDHGFFGYVPAIPFEWFQKQ